MKIKNLVFAGLPLLCLTGMQAHATPAELMIKAAKSHSTFLFPNATQKILITGTVVDENSQPVPGVGVKSLKNNKATVTDAAGRFSIEVENATDQLHSAISAMKLKLARQDQALLLCKLS